MRELKRELKIEIMRELKREGLNRELKSDLNKALKGQSLKKLVGAMPFRGLFYLRMIWKGDTFYFYTLSRSKIYQLSFINST